MHSFFKPLAGVLALGSACSAAQASLPATAGAATASAAPAPGAELSREVLPNGVTLVVNPNPTSNVVGMELVSRVGTQYEAVGQEGLASLALRVALDSATTAGNESVEDWFEDRGASLLAQAHPDYSEVGAAVVSSDFPAMAALMAGLVRQPGFSAARLAAAQQAAVSDIQSSASNEQGMAYLSLRKLLADDTAYGRSETGRIGAVARLALPDVDGFFHRMFAPGSLVVAVSGNVDRARAMRLLEEQFGSLPAQPVLPPPAIREGTQEPSSMVSASNGDAAWIMVGYPLPGVRSAEYPAALVLNAILGGSSSGTLTSLFRDRNGVYDSGSFLQPFADQAQIVGYVRADPLLWNQQHRKMEPVVDDFQHQLAGVFAAVHDHGVTDEQVKRAREFVRGQLLRTHDHNRQWAAYLGWYEAIGRGADFDRQLISLVEQVTPEQVNRLASTALGSSQGATVIVFPRPRAEEVQ